MHFKLIQLRILYNKLIHSTTIQREPCRTETANDGQMAVRRSVSSDSKPSDDESALDLIGSLLDSTGGIIDKYHQSLPPLRPFGVRL